MLITAVPAATGVRTMAPLQSTAVQCGNVARLRYIVSFRVRVRVQDSVVRVQGLGSRVWCLGSRVSGLQCCVLLETSLLAHAFLDITCAFLTLPLRCHLTHATPGPAEVEGRLLGVCRALGDARKSSSTTPRSASRYSTAH
jgi:hypothetical protein